MKRIITILGLALAITGAKAEEKFFQLSLIPDIAIYPRETHIKGLALNIWGENPQTALNLGFVNGSTGDSAGLSWGLVNYADDYTGVHWGMVNWCKGSFTGWQNAWVNVSQDFKGLQSGLINYSENTTGVQFGLVNYTEKMNGLQIGAINVIRDNPWFTEFPNKLATGFVFVNWSF